MPHGGGLFLVGPSVLTLLLAVLACAALTGAWAGQLGRMLALGARARVRCGQRRAASALWGFSAGALVFAVSALLVRSHLLALFGIVILLAGVVVLGLGLGVAAWVTGDALTGTEGAAGDSAWGSLKAGLALLLLASCLPFAGWLLCLVAVAAGTGAVLETLVARE